VVISVGTAVLEARALMALLHKIARHQFGEALKVPNIATWWCGEQSKRKNAFAYEMQFSDKVADVWRFPSVGISLELMRMAGDSVAI
jgi:hypothetical protein